MTLHERFSAQAARTPHAVALTFGAQSLTYAELDTRSNQLAHQLLMLGVGPEVMVAMLVERSLEMIVGILGVLKAGGAYVPMDPAYPADRIAFQLADCAAPVVLSQRALLPQLPATNAAVLCLDEPLTGPTHAPRSAATAESLAYVIYTSGSTGAPKGCLVEHRNVLPLFDNTTDWFGISERDVWTLFHSYAFDFSVWEIWGALLFGGRLVIVPQTVSRAADAFHRLIRAENVTILNQSPTAFSQLLLADERAPERLTSLRTVILAAEKLDIPSLRPWFDRYGDSKPKLANLYGITETTVFVSYRPLTVADTESSISPIGGAFPGWTMQILDEDRQPVAVGDVGEIYVGGVGVTRGYLGRPELNAERFVEIEGERLYKSGDLVRLLESGELDYVGRSDFQVKLRGHRIELGEIESAIGRFPGVRGCAVLLTDDRLVGYLLGENIATAAIPAFLKDRLPTIMIPMSFIVLDAFPMTTNGKLDRRALPTLASTTPNLATAPAVRGGAEQVAAIWRRVIGLTDQTPLGLDESFFDVGGHSLLMPALRKALATEAGIEISLVELFERATIRQQLARPAVTENRRTPQAHGTFDRMRSQREVGARLRRP